MGEHLLCLRSEWVNLTSYVAGNRRHFEGCLARCGEDRTGILQIDAEIEHEVSQIPLTGLPLSATSEALFVQSSLDYPRLP